MKLRMIGIFPLIIAAFDQHFEHESCLIALFALLWSLSVDGLISLSLCRSSLSDRDDRMKWIGMWFTTEENQDSLSGEEFVRLFESAMTKFPDSERLFAFALGALQLIVSQRLIHLFV